jgi:hypothetical protein
MRMGIHGYGVRARHRRHIRQPHLRVGIDDAQDRRGLATASGITGSCDQQ